MHIYARVYTFLTNTTTLFFHGIFSLPFLICQQKKLSLGNVVRIYFGCIHTMMARSNMNALLLHIKRQLIRNVIFDMFQQRMATKFAKLSDGISGNERSIVNICNCIRVDRQDKVYTTTKFIGCLKYYVLAYHVYLKYTQCVCDIFTLSPLSKSEENIFWHAN